MYKMRRAPMRRASSPPRSSKPSARPGSEAASNLRLSMPWLLGSGALLALLASTALFANDFTAAFAPPGATVAVEGDLFSYAAAATEVLPNIRDPKAVDAQRVCPGYKADGFVPTEFGFEATLRLAGGACNVYGDDVGELKLKVEYQSVHRLAVSISPAQIDASNKAWYVLDEDVVPKPGVEYGSTGTVQSGDLQLVYANDPSFSFKVIRRSSGEALFDTTGSKLVYENQFIEFVTAMPANYNVYGLGERIHGLRLGNNFTATMWAADVGDLVDENIYGVHPVYLDTRYYEQSEGGKETLVTESDSIRDDAQYRSYSHGVYLRNAHGQEILLREKTITWRTIGGSMDLYFYSGPTPMDVIKQHQQVVGLPAMQQYFSLGYHQCRWGYQNWTVLQEVVDNFTASQLPLETIWTDIDYMKQYRDFDMDPNTFPVDKGKAFLERLHQNHQHYIPIVDSAIYIPDTKNESDAYGTYARGNASGVFLTNVDGSQYIGQVWPGLTVFPDWRAPKATDWWADEFKRWYADIKFDGIWIDMSEVSSFCAGSCGSVARTGKAAPLASGGRKPGERDVNYPPYVINNVQGELAAKAVSPNATHADGVQEYDVHNLFGHQILTATYEALTRLEPTKRPLIIGRSTFASSGRYAGHWGGDNYSNYTYMALSIPQALSFSLFGIPMFGVDACGFTGNATEDLCARWMELSAFMPFFRNHNNIENTPQEPYRWPAVAEATRKAAQIRYSLLPYMYTLLQRAHAAGEPVLRALAWEFPDDPRLAALDTQFLLGPALLVVPVLAENATSVAAVFPGTPAQKWYDWYTRAAVEPSAPRRATLQAPQTHIPLFVRGGSVIPLQRPAATTFAARQQPWDVLVALDAAHRAAGSLYLDDGVSVAPAATLEVAFSARPGELAAALQGTYGAPQPLGSVTVLGVEREPAGVSLDGRAVAAESVSWGEGGVLRIEGFEGLLDAAWARNWTLRWA